MNLCRAIATFVTITRPAAGWIPSQPQGGSTITTAAGIRRLELPFQLLSGTVVPQVPAALLCHYVGCDVGSASRARERGLCNQSYVNYAR